MVSVWKQIRHSILVAFQTESIDTRSDVKNDMNLTINMNWKLELSWRLIYSWSEGQRRQKENFKVRISFVRAWLLEVWTFGGANPRHARQSIRSAVIWESVRVPKNPNWDLYCDVSVTFTFVCCSREIASLHVLLFLVTARDHLLSFIHTLHTYAYIHCIHFIHTLHTFIITLNSMTYFDYNSKMRSTMNMCYVVKGYLQSMICRPFHIPSTRTKLITAATFAIFTDFLSPFDPY
jgi:hypothetical protein